MIHPADYSDWFAEVTPAFVIVIVLIATFHKLGLPIGPFLSRDHDGQWDMLSALSGAIVSLLLLGKAHNKNIEKIYEDGDS